MTVLNQCVISILIITMAILSPNTSINKAEDPENTSASHPPVASKLADNPLLTEWKGPFGGIPPFDEVKVEYFKPALEAGMKTHLDEIERISAANEDPPFENTIAAIERSGKMMDRVMRIYSIWSGNMNNSEFQAVQREMAPKLAAHSDQIVQNEKLFRRIESIYNAREKSNLTPEQQRLVWLHYTNFMRSG